MSDDAWNQDNAWAEPPRKPENAAWTDAGEADWAEDIRTGAAWQMTGQAVIEPQSGLGILSLVLSLVAGLMIALPLAFGVAMVAQNPNMAPHEPIVAGVACTMLLGLLLAVFAGILGLVGLFQPNRRKTCAVIGLLFAGGEVLGIAGLFVIGLLAG